MVPARTTGEARYAMIARYQGKVWTGIFTVRGDRVRIIKMWIGEKLTAAEQAKAS